MQRQERLEQIPTDRHAHLCPKERTTHLLVEKLLGFVETENMAATEN